MEGKEKKVELIELFYDLIFVYAISNLTLLMEEPEEGIVTLEMFIVYNIFFLVITQAWFMMTNYINHCCSWKWYEYLLVILNMSAIVMMTQTINDDPENSADALLYSMLVIVGCVIVLYVIHCLKNGPQKVYARRSLMILLPIVGVYVAAISLRSTGFENIAQFILVANLGIGIVLPHLNRGDKDDRCVYFAHLVERMELFAIIMFGEALISITGFFNLNEPEPIGFLNFLVIVLMFGFYVCQVHFMCDHHKAVVPNRMIYCHYFIYLAISLATLAFIYIVEKEVDSLFSASLMALSMVIFIVSIHATSVYRHERFKRFPGDVAMSLLFIAAGSALMIIFNNEEYMVAIGALLGYGLNFAYSWMKYIRGRAVAEAD